MSGSRTKKKAVKRKAVRRSKMDMLRDAAELKAPKKFITNSWGGELEIQTWYNTNLPKHGGRVVSIDTCSDDSEGSVVCITFHEAEKLRGIIKSLQAVCRWLEG